MTVTLPSTVRVHPQLVIFDLDGTLTDSARGIVSSFRHALGEIGAVVPDGDLASRVVGPPLHHTLCEMGLGDDADIAGASVDGSRATKSEVLAHALTQLQPLPDRVLMVGDRCHDVEGAAEHGIGTVVVGWGYGRMDFARPHAARGLAYVSTVEDLREVLGV